MGHTFKLGIVKIRPVLGLGNATTSVTVASPASPGAAAATGSYSSSNLYVEPGVLVMVSLGQPFVGADANALALPDVISGDTRGLELSLNAHVQLGVQF